MKGINKLGKVITKILEVFHWVGAALMTAATVCSAVAPDWVKYFVGFDAKECCEYSCAVTPPVRQTGNRLSRPTETACASLLA